MSDICSAPGDDSEAAVMKSCAVNRASLIYPSEQMSSRNKRSGAPTMLAATAGRSKDQLLFLFLTRLMTRTGRQGSHEDPTQGPRKKQKHRDGGSMAADVIIGDIQVSGLWSSEFRKLTINVIISM